MDFSRVAYCPLDIPKIKIDECVIARLLSLYQTDHHDGLWNCLPLRGRVIDQSQFMDSEAFEVAWERRYEPSGEVLDNENVKRVIPELFEHMQKLPLHVTHAQLLQQTKDVGKHYDLKHTGSTFHDDCIGFNDAVEPAGYKVLLNQFNSESFYVSRAFGQPNQYIKLPSDTNTFCINEKTFPHGATLLQTPKYIVSIFGLIDREKHLALLENSFKKYSSFVISY